MIQFFKPEIVTVTNRDGKEESVTFSHTEPVDAVVLYCYDCYSELKFGDGSIATVESNLFENLDIEPRNIAEPRNYAWLGWLLFLLMGVGIFCLSVVGFTKMKWFTAVTSFLMAILTIVSSVVFLRNVKDK